jgi:hypothetical protein
MNKLTKIGASALCGSLAAVSAAHAGELTVTGGADMTWISLDKEVTGNPIGIGSNMGFTGSGELDNGIGVALGIYHANTNSYTETNIQITVPSLGTFQVDQGSTGTGIDRFDDVTPTVWEESHGAGVATGIDTVSGVSGGANIEYTPNMMPDGITARIAFSPAVGGGKSADKGSSGDDASTLQSGFGVVAQIDGNNLGMDGLTVYAGLSNIGQDSAATGISGDKDERTIAFKYAMGAFTIGAQVSEEDMGTSSGVKQYDNMGYGVTFSVNDNLSIGYNHFESDQDNHTTADVTAEASSVQIAYTMGGASIRLAEIQTSNNLYNSTATQADDDATVISLGLAF